MFINIPYKIDVLNWFCLEYQQSGANIDQHPWKEHQTHIFFNGF